MRVAVLVKQVPKIDSLQMGPDGRLKRDGIELEMNAYCRRAVSKGVDLAHGEGGSCTVFTLGPPGAADVLREAVAWGADDGVLITGPEFAGSDTLATARALAAALRLAGDYDLILAGRNSIDSDTGQVAPQVAELLQLPFLGGVRELEMIGSTLRARCETDDGWMNAEVRLPALISAAERLCDPAKSPPMDRAAVPADRIRQVSAAELGAGPWGEAGSTTRVGDVRVVRSPRARRRHHGSVGDQVKWAVGELLALDAFGAPAHSSAQASVPDGWTRGPRIVAVIVEPSRPRCARELLGAAARIAQDIDGSVWAVAPGPRHKATELSSWGADGCVRFTGVSAAATASVVVAQWCAETQPWAVLVPGTMWGREVASRTAARIGAGLTGDAIELTVEDDRLVAWKPALGGEVVAAITATTDVQLVTVRPGVLPESRPRPPAPIAMDERLGSIPSRVRVVSTERDDELEPLASAEVVVAVGQGVAPDELPQFTTLCRLLNAEIGATRKVTDAGWLPRARQIGITGRSIAPRLYLAFGVSGSLNHAAGIRGARTILAVNHDPSASIFDHADIGVVGDWRVVLPLLTSRLAELDAVALSASV